jgi:hypothetical protein
VQGSDERRVLSFTDARAENESIEACDNQRRMAASADSESARDDPAKACRPF